MPTTGDLAMATSDKQHPGPGRQRRVDEERTFQWLFWLSFPIFLAVTLGDRALPKSKSGEDTGMARVSLFSEAAAAARSTIAIALTD
jgi:hypothetical protein